MSDWERRHREREAARRADEAYERRMLEIASAEREAQHFECRSNGYRPDETDLFRDLREERDWERSTDEWERWS